MVGAIIVAYLLFGQLGNWMRLATTEMWSAKTTTISAEAVDLNHQVSQLIFSGLGVLAPLVLLLMLFGVLSHWCQTGPFFSVAKTSPDLARLAPTHWFNRLFSLRTLTFPIIGLPKAVLAIAVMFISCWINREQFFMLGAYAADEMIRQMFSLILLVCSHVTLALLLASMLDFGTTWLSFQKRIRMNDQELRDELRSQNGDPQIASQQRERRRTLRQID